MSRFTTFSLNAGDVAEAAGGDSRGVPGMPDITDLSSLLRFIPQQGEVWLDDQRMVILNLQSLVTLRRELVETLGPRRAREILFRMGHAAGTREAVIALKVRADEPEIDAFLVGPQLHALRGEVFVEPTRIEADSCSGTYYNELVWRNSAEAQAHVSCFGGSSEPVCWMQIGYASGYTSAMMERPMLFKEVECVACGDATCRIVGRPAEDWSDDADAVQMPLVAVRSEHTHADNTPMGIVGTSPGFLGAWHLLNRVASLDTTVLLRGESGVGKEVFAQALHAASTRAKKKLFCVNCAAIPESLIDTELFGVERGAFTGAAQSRPGWFEAADGSTLFLDEIGTLSLTTQAKLLRVIQEGEFNRVGSTVTRRVNVRLVCATNQNLEEEVEHSRFRLDLLHQLNVFPIVIPPLRERREDIPPLVGFFLRRFIQRTGRRISGFTQSAIDGLLTYSFPGNVRQLENMIERAAILTLEDEPIDMLHLFHGINQLRKVFYTPVVSDQDGALHLTVPYAAERALAGESPRIRSLADVEGQAIREALQASDGNLSKAARRLGLTRAKLRYRVKRTTTIQDFHRKKSGANI
jgi:two-component system response regulator HydG